jgi:phage replication-related protein YjqB (UPF0714/DUF867 family)
MSKSCDPFFRRDFLKTLGIAALPILTHGCDVESPPPETFRAKPAGKGNGKGKPQPQPNTTTTDVTVGRALTSQTLINDRQRCSLPMALSGICGIGRQLRVIRPDYGAAIYTLDECRADDDPKLVRMNLYGRLRLGESESFAGIVSNQVTASGLSDAEAQAQGEFVERLVDNGKNTGLVALAPHGGAIELETDRQAERVTQLLKASSWICKGWRQGGGAFDAWHIRSTDLHPESFDGLAAIANRGFAYAVSFHGMEGTGGVIIGGGTPLELKQLVATAIRTAIGNSTVPVGIASPTDIYDGDSDTNIVNWLTADGRGGVQLEQDRTARVEYGLKIANAVANVFASLL